MCPPFYFPSTHTVFLDEPGNLLFPFFFFLHFYAFYSLLLKFYWNIVDFIMLISTVQESDSFIRICSFSFSFLLNFYHRILNIFPCALQQDCCLSILLFLDLIFLIAFLRSILPLVDISVLSVKCHFELHCQFTRVYL